MKQIIKAFIIGSCWFSFVLLFIGFGRIQEQVDKNNCVEKYIGINTYHGYSISAPFYLGLMSAIAIWMRDKYNMSTRKAFFIIGIISGLIVSVIISVCHIYDWSKNRYIWQYIKLQFYHFILYSVIIANLYIYLDSP